MNGAVTKLTLDGDVREVALEIVNDGYDDSAHGNKKYYVAEKEVSSLIIRLQAISIINRESKKGVGGRRAAKRRRNKRTVKGSSKKKSCQFQEKGNVRKKKSRRRHRRTKRRL